MGTPVLTGLDVLKRDGFSRLRGMRLGVLTNPSAVDGGYRHLLDLLGDAGVRVEAIFGPEHGLFSTAQDMVGVSGERHQTRVVSLYGDSFDSLSPKEEDLRGLDAVVFDVQDVGSRYYTYVWTLALLMEVASRTGTRVVVLDRPNPITASRVEGGGLLEGLRSFVGWRELPNRHGLTAGEIARHEAGALADEGKRVDLDVVWMEGYGRGLWFEETGAPWVLPSPNMPTAATALVYPGQCLLEGTNLSEGRGTTRPFEVFGAPFVEGARLAAALEGEGLPGVCFRALYFQPAFQKWAGQRCGGVQIHVLDREAYRSCLTSVAILRHVRELWGGEFQWRRESYEFRDDVPAIDLLTGHPGVRERIDSGARVDEIMDFWESTGVAARAARESACVYAG